MAKKKTAKPVEVEEVIEEVVEEVKEEKPQVLMDKKSICEFYGIQDGEILDKNNDLSKYELKDAELTVLKEWAEETSKALVKDVTFDFYTCSEEVRDLIGKYGVTPEHVVNDTMWDLGMDNEEQEIIKNYYNERAVDKRAQTF